jgi:hypothetical protein
LGQPFNKLRILDCGLQIEGIWKKSGAGTPINYM